MKKLNRAVIILSKIIEIFCWVGCALLIAMLGCVILGKPEWVSFLSTLSVDAPTQEGISMSIMGNSGLKLTLFDAQGVFLPSCLAMLCVCSLLTMFLSGMVFRNIALIFKTAQGETKFSKGSTPFQPDNIRMVREIGIFLIAIPIVELICSIAARLILPVEMVSYTLDLFVVLVGLVVLALSQYFAYGMELQSEVDGLL